MAIPQGRDNHHKSGSSVVPHKEHVPYALWKICDTFASNLGPYVNTAAYRCYLSFRSCSSTPLRGFPGSFPGARRYLTGYTYCGHGHRSKRRRNTTSPAQYIEEVEALPSILVAVMYIRLLASGTYVQRSIRLV